MSRRSIVPLLGAFSLACASVSPLETVEDISYQLGYAACADTSLTTAWQDSAFNALMFGATNAYLQGCVDADIGR